MQNEDNESGFNPKQLEEEIKNQQRIVNKKEESLNTIQKNPKASLAIAGIVFAALVIGMIALLGGVGMIDGALLGKVVLSAVTAGTAAFGAKKLYDLVKGDKDKNQLRKLERMRKDHRRMEVDKRAREAELELANLKKQAEDQRMVDRAFKEGWEKYGGEVKGTNKGYIRNSTVKLTPDQNKLYEEMSKLDKANDDLKDITKKLSDTQTASLVNSIKILSTKLGMPDKDPKKIEDLKELLDADVKKFDGNALDAGGSPSPNRDLLKEVLRAGLGLDKDDKSITQDSPHFIDAQGRIKILKGLNEALQDFDNSNPKFKDNASRNDKEVVDTLVDLMKLVNSEKTRTKEAKAKSAGRGGA